ncbi:MAG: TerB family tellurite resistance protein [Saprospirales bacterium]|nr:TerB family tellurite resistance protein [Saprospirales bacterium]
MSAVEEQIGKSPLSTRFDREVLARILVELASADGEIESAEQEFLESVVGAEFGSINELMAMEPVSPVECEELNPGVRETIYLLAWVMSLVDLDVNPSERSILMEYAGMFGFSGQKTEEIIRKARLYLLESSIAADTSREELFSLADSLGVDRNDAERALIQLKKRM